MDDNTKRLTRGFRLFQPWASEVVNGNLKYLVRSTNITLRERVAVIASKGIDGIWIKYASNKDIMKLDE